MKINALDGLDELLADVYEKMKRHERMLTELSASVMAWTEVFQSSGFATPYAQAFEAAKKSLEEQGSSTQLGLYDGIIQRLRHSE